VLAIVQEGYGPPTGLRLREVERPTAGDGEVLVRVKASSVHPDVWHVITGRPFALRLMGSGLGKPRQPIPGTDVAGVVETVGRGVTGFRPGDEVFGLSLPGMVWRNGGAFAEFVGVPQDGLVLKPANVTFEQAATVPMAGFIILINVDLALLGPRRRVLVNGAAGGVGGMVVQIAKAHGAEVTGVDHTDKLDLIRSLGADDVIDYTREDFTRGDRRYDLIVDIPGNHPFPTVRRALAPGGKYVLIGHDHYGSTGHRWLGSIPRMMGLMARSSFDPHLRSGGWKRPTKQEAMRALADYLEAGQLTPVIDRVFPLAEAGQAIDYLAAGRPIGRIAITVP
jgi:NADPH:quinone reductase-like Zn-dependent oxidoreductase